MCTLLYFHAACGHRSYYRYNHRTSSVHPCHSGSTSTQQQQQQQPCNQIVDEVAVEGYCTTCFMRDFERNRSLVRAMRAARELGFKMDIEEVKKVIDSDIAEKQQQQQQQQSQENAVNGGAEVEGLEGIEGVEVLCWSTSQGKKVDGKYWGDEPGSMEAQDGSGDDEEDEERRGMRISSGGRRRRIGRRVLGSVGVPPGFNVGVKKEGSGGGEEGFVKEGVKGVGSGCGDEENAKPVVQMDTQEDEEMLEYGVL